MDYGTWVGLRYVERGGQAWKDTQADDITYIVRTNIAGKHVGPAVLDAGGVSVRRWRLGSSGPPGP